jgi:hypothetical protein
MSPIPANEDPDLPFEGEEHDGVLRLNIPGKTNWNEVWILSAIILAVGSYGTYTFVKISGGDVRNHPLDLLMAVWAVGLFLYGLAKALFSNQTIQIDASTMRIRNTIMGLGFTRSYELIAVTDLEFVPEHDEPIKSKNSTTSKLSLRIGWFSWSNRSDEPRRYPSQLAFHYGTKPVMIAPGLRPDEMLKLLKVLAPYLAPAKLLYEKAYESRAVTTFHS